MLCSCIFPAFAAGLTISALVISCAPSNSPAKTGGRPSKAEIVEALKKASTGNISDAVDATTGHRGFMYHDMKPIFKAKIVGPAATESGELLRR